MKILTEECVTQNNIVRTK